MLEVERIGKSFGALSVLRDVSLRLDRGQITTLVGTSGVGKTTLLRIIAGLERADAGTVVIDGETATRAGAILIPPHRRTLGFVFQAPALWPHMTVAQNILFAVSHLDAPARSRRLADLLRATGLEPLAARHPSEISAGQARRVALARTLAAAPRYLLMDEPFSNLDPQARKDLASLALEHVREGGMGMLYVTHDPGDRELIGGNVLSLRDGELTEG
jgi:iron(III) transport system ATP-binding protein